MEVVPFDVRRLAKSLNKQYSILLAKLGEWYCIQPVQVNSELLTHVWRQATWRCVRLWIQTSTIC